MQIKKTAGGARSLVRTGAQIIAYGAGEIRKAECSQRLRKAAIFRSLVLPVSPCGTTWLFARPEGVEKEAVRKESMARNYSYNTLLSSQSMKKKPSCLLTSRKDLFAPHTLPAAVLPDGDIGNPWVLKFSGVEVPVPAAGPEGAGTGAAVEKEEEDAVASFSA